LVHTFKIPFLLTFTSDSGQNAPAFTSVFNFIVCRFDQLLKLLVSISNFSKIATLIKQCERNINNKSYKNKTYDWSGIINLLPYKRLSTLPQDLVACNGYRKYTASTTKYFCSNLQARDAEVFSSTGGHLPNTAARISDCNGVAQRYL